MTSLTNPLAPESLNQKVGRKRHFTAYLGFLAVATAASCGPVPQAGDETEVTTQAFTTSAPGTRPTINSLPASERTVLANAILDFITQPILDEHSSAHDWHHPGRGTGSLFFTRHHEYLNKLESFLAGRGLNRFIPVPMWDPGSPIPAELTVLDPLVSGRLNPNPNLPKPAEFSNVCAFKSLEDLAVRIETWHDDVHVTVAGAMGVPSTAPGAPIFWLWHGLLDDMYHAYEQCPGVGNDILWVNTQEKMYSVWQLDGPTQVRSFGVAIPLPTGFFIQGRGDFNLDGSQDLLVWDAIGGGAEVWFMKGINKNGSVRVGTLPRPWRPSAAGDFDSNGVPDILWRNTTTNRLAIWFMDRNGVLLRSTELAPSSRAFYDAGDFDGDGRMDLLFAQNGTYEVSFMNGATVEATTTFTMGTTAGRVVGRSAGRADSIGFHMANGEVRLVTASRQGITNTLAGSGVGSDWTLKGIGDPNRDGRGDLLWHHSTGVIGFWQQDANGAFTGTAALSTVTNPWYMLGTLTDRSF